MILLGLTEGESQNRIYTTASSSLEASTSRSTRPEPPRRVRKFAKQDLVVSVNFSLVFLCFVIVSLYNMIITIDIVLPP